MEPRDTIKCALISFLNSNLFDYAGSDPMLLVISTMQVQHINTGKYIKASNIRVVNLTVAESITSSVPIIVG
jgi:hypothetical protein